MTLLFAFILWFALMCCMAGPYLMLLVWACNTAWGKRSPQWVWGGSIVVGYPLLMCVAAYVAGYWYVMHS
jgi:hypothetical protein